MRAEAARESLQDAQHYLDHAIYMLAWSVPSEPPERETKARRAQKVALIDQLWDMRCELVIPAWLEEAATAEGAERHEREEHEHE